MSIYETSGIGPAFEWLYARSLFIDVHFSLVNNLCVYCLFHSKKKSSSNYYNSPYPAEEFQTTWPSHDIPRIPRATLTSSSSVDAAGNSLEMSEGPGKTGHRNGLVSTSFQSKCHK